MAVYRCLLCYPDVKECANLSNMKSHLGTANHNMGPYRCQVPGCTKRAVRDDIETRHGTPSHAPDWVKDQALVAPLDTLAQQCQYPWAPQFAPATCEPAPLAATQGPPVAAQGHSVSVSVAHAPVQGSLTGTPIAAVQGPPATAQTPAVAAFTAPQAPGVAQITPAAAQVHPVATQVPAVVTPTAQVLAGVASAAAQFPPPTNYFRHAMDDFERRYAGKTREDIEKQYEEERELYYYDYNTTDKGNFKSHLGRVDDAHNMGPYVCQRPGCNVRSNRRDSPACHDSHPGIRPDWVKDANLVAALDTELAVSERPAPLIPSTAGPAPRTTASPARSTTTGPARSTNISPTPPYFGPFINPGRFQYPDPSLLAASNNHQGIFYGASTQGEDDDDNKDNNNEDKDPSGASAQFEHENPEILAHGEDEDNNNASDDNSENSREYLMRTGVAPLFMEAMKLLSFADPPVEKPLLWAGKWFEARSREIEGADEEGVKKEDGNEVRKGDQKEDQKEDEIKVQNEDDKDDEKEHENDDKKEDENK
ncbi:hypothetical protein KCU77_g5422, partial [Aureobasidium melanogenum]